MRNWTLGHYGLIFQAIGLLIVSFLTFQNQQELDAIRQLQNLELQDAQQPRTPVSEKSHENARYPPQAPSPQTLNPHATKIQAIDTSAGLKLSRISKLIVRDEGERNRPYADPKGVATIGVGRNLESNGISLVELKAIAGEIDYELVLSKARSKNGRVYIDSLDLANRVFVKPLTEADMQLLLMDDLKNVISEAKKVFPKVWNQVDPVRQEVIVDVLFNLGLTHFKKFVNFIDVVKRQDWQSAGDELLKSTAARENPSRYFRNYHVIVTGNGEYFGLRK